MIDCFCACIRAIFYYWPDCVICGSDSLSIFVILAAYIPRLLFLKKIRIIFFESTACVTQFSTVGKLSIRFSDIFSVQWPQLEKLHWHASYTGRFDCANSFAPLKTDDISDKQHKSDEHAILVVVGSGTKFDALMRSVDTPAFISAIIRLGFTSMKVFPGEEYVKCSNDYGLPHNILKHSGFGFKYSLLLGSKQTLYKEVSKSKFILGHLDAGLLLIALSVGAIVMAVPNTSAFYFQESEMAKAFFSQQVIAGVVEESELEDLAKALSAALKSVDFSKIRHFPPASLTLGRMITALLTKKTIPWS